MPVDVPLNFGQHPRLNQSRPQTNFVGLTQTKFLNKTLDGIPLTLLDAQDQHATALRGVVKEWNAAGDR